MANCSVFWNHFSGNLPDSLMEFFIFYCCAICFVGLACNVVALWCVVGCPRTRRPVKILLCAIFLPTLLMCLLVMPFMAFLSLAKLRCDVHVDMWAIQGWLLLYIVLTEMEICHILVMAFFRTVAVRSPQRHQVKLRASVAIAVGVGIYATLPILTLMTLYWMDVLDKPTAIIISRALNFPLFFFPQLLTLICYSSMIFAIRRNKHRLAATPDTAATGQQVMDQATRAMLAVFVSNLLFVLPHSIYHILPYDPQVFSYVIVHIVFYMHLFVDPLVFVCLNLHHRQRVLHALKSCLRWVSCRPPPTLSQATSTLPLHVTPPTSSLELQRDQS